MGAPEIATILVAEDEPDLSELITMEFSIRGHRTYSALDGRKAFEIAERQPVDLIVTDVRMPHMSGLELLDTMKARDPFRPAVIFISAYADFALPQVYSRGAEGFFTKPFRLSSLTERADYLLAQRGGLWCGRAGADAADPAIRLEPAEGAGEVLLGRGGALVTGPGPAVAHSGQRVRLAVACAQLDGARLDGVGAIKWACDTVDHQVEYGVELESLEEDSRRRYVEWLASARPVAYIPVRD